MSSGQTKKTRKNKALRLNDKRKVLELYQEGYNTKAIAILTGLRADGVAYTIWDAVSKGNKPVVKPNKVITDNMSNFIKKLGLPYGPIDHELFMIEIGGDTIIIKPY